MHIPLVLRQLAAPAISLGLVAGLWVEQRLFHLPAGDATAYHASIRAVADRLPYRIGEWAATDVKTPTSAVSLLRPNLLIGRQFRNSVTGEQATFMIVQCGDARDMSGHFPPACYPSNGWTQHDARQRMISVGALEIPVTVYQFTIESLARYSEIIVYNFFLRPDGVLESGRGGVRTAAEDPRMKIFGAGQVQVAFDPSIGEARRDEIFRVLVSGARPIIDAVLSGATR